MSLKMLFDYVLVKAEEAKTETASGFLLASAAVEQPAKGTVVSVGEGKFASTGVRIEHGIQVGDQVIFSKSAMNQPLEHNGEQYHVMLAEQIFGVDR